MTPENILEVVRIYKERFVREEIPKKRIDPEKSFSFYSQNELLAHAHYLMDGIEQYVDMSGKVGKTGRHLGSAQTLMSVAGWYTLEELKSHNRPD